MIDPRPYVALVNRHELYRPVVDRWIDLQPDEGLDCDEVLRAAVDAVKGTDYVLSVSVEGPSTLVYHISGQTSDKITGVVVLHPDLAVDYVSVLKNIPAALELLATGILTKGTTRRTICE